MKKNGFTLIELMVGMLISMLCIVMMLALFQQLSRASLSSSRAADYDTQLETGILMAQKLMQNAGYGSGKAIDVATGYVTFGTNNTTADSTNSGTPAIFWREGVDPINSSTNAGVVTYTPSSYKCYGLAETVVQNGNNYVHHLTYLTKASCDGPTADAPAISDLTKMTGWSAQSLNRINVNTAEVTAAANAANTTPDTIAGSQIFTFTKSGTCAPFGTLNVQGGAKVMIEAKRLDATLSDIQRIQRAVCLRNIS